MDIPFTVYPERYYATPDQSSLTSLNSGYDRIERVEVVMFNCPQWGIASTTIQLDGANARSQPFNTLNLTSVSSLTPCESLVRVCLSAPRISTTNYIIHP